MRRESAFTGLEAGIILIAFVIAASVFAYTTLTAGFFTAEKAEEVTAESSQEASAVLYAEGAIYGSLYNGGPSDGQLETVSFTMSIPSTGLAQDISKMIIIYTQFDRAGHVVNLPRTYRFGGTTASGLLFGVENGDTEPVMQPNERRIFTMTALEGPVTGGYFTIETKPKNGIGAFIKKTLPGAFEGGAII